MKSRRFFAMLLSILLILQAIPASTLAALADEGEPWSIMAAGATLVHTVRFVDYNGDVIESQDVEHGGDATPPTVTRAGYTFKEWVGTYTNVEADQIVTASYTFDGEALYGLARLGVKLDDA